MRVQEIWRYPVKSMAGEQMSKAVVTELGIEGDRGWGIVDLASGTVLTARRTPELLFASATLTNNNPALNNPELNNPELCITLPEGTKVGGPSPDSNRVLSQWLGQEVELRSAGDEGGTYENPMDFENDDDWVSWTGPAGAWHDSTRSRLSLVTSTTLGSWPLSRFRTNVLLSGEGEDSLVGGFANLGTEVKLEVKKQIDRCVMVTRPQPGLERDLEVLRTINSERGTTLSVGATIMVGGTIACGDQLNRSG